MRIVLWFEFLLTAFVVIDSPHFVRVSTSRSALAQSRSSRKNFHFPSAQPTLCA